MNLDVNLDDLPDELNENSVVDMQSNFRNKEKVPKHLSDKFEKKKTDKEMIQFKETCNFLVKSFKEIQQLPKKDQLYHLITQNSFNAISILLYLIEKFGVLEEAYLTGSSFDIKTARALDTLIRGGKIKRCVYLMSSMRLTETNEKINILKSLAESDFDFELIFAWNHTKIISCKSNNGKYYSIMGTGNLSNNARVEEYFIVSSKKTYEFNKNWIDKIETFSAKKDVTRYGK